MLARSQRSRKRNDPAAESSAGVVSASLVETIPVANDRPLAVVQADVNEGGASADERQSRPRVLLNHVSPGHFRTLGIGLIGGRDFRREDDNRAARVAVVNETMARSRWVFRSTDNECEAVMASLMAVKHFRGQFVTVAGINPDYSYGRNNFAAFQALLKKFGIEHTSCEPSVEGIAAAIKPNTISEKYSAGPNFNATSASGGAK